MTAIGSSIRQPGDGGTGRPAARLRRGYRHRWLTLTVLSLSMLLIVIDTTIVNIAIPALAGALHADAAELEWIADAYTLTFAALLLPAGSLGDRFGRHRALAAGMAVFGAASLGAALSATPAELIGWRAVMGAGAALVMPATMAIMTDLFTGTAERARAIGIWSGTSGLGVAIGPTAGGWLLTHFPWGSIFAVNLPVVAAALIAGYFLVPPSAAASRPRFDPPGTLLAVLAFGVLTYTIIDAASAGWTSAVTVLGGALSAALLAGLAAWEISCDQPMMDVRLCRNPHFTVAVSAIAILFFGVSGATFVLTQIYQFVLGYSPLGAGIRWLPSALALTVAVPLSTRLATRIGIRAVVTAGLLTAAAGLGFLALATGRSGYSHYLIAATILAVGTGLTTPAATQSVLASLTPTRVGIGSAMSNSARNLGAVLGVAVLGSIAATSYSRAMAGYPRDGAAGSGLSRAVLALARQSVGAAAQVTRYRHAAIADGPVHALQAAAGRSFVHGASIGAAAAAAAALGAAAATAWLLR